ncbi:MAG: DNA repair exonuclease [Thermoguttaceae bacterium]|nr:DNA repair exonuclease [Thermoguttaceae bacterium]
MSLKFIHCADLHLDSPMRGLGTTDPEIAEKIREASRRAFRRLIDVALEENVAFVAVAGDLFDGDWDDLATGLWTIRELRRLEARRIPVFISFGNHDLQNKTLPKLTWPKNVKIFNAKKPETFLYPDDLPQLLDGAPKRGRKTAARPVATVENTLFGDLSDAAPSSLFDGASERVALTGQSFRAQFCPENLAENFPSATPNAFNIGVLHTDVGGDGAASRYAPTSLETLNSKRYDYWALGHVHRRQTLQTSPAWVGYPGVLQGRHIREPEPKGFYLVEIENGALLGEPRFVAVDSLRWFSLELDLTQIASEEELRRRFQDAAQTIVDEAEERFAAVRLSLVGRTELHRELTQRRARQTLGETFRAWALELGDAFWLEEIELKTTSPRPATLGDTGILGDLAADFERKIAELSARLAALESSQPSADQEFEDAELPFADLEKRVGAYWRELGINPDDPATLRRWREEAREILIDAFNDAE